MKGIYTFKQNGEIIAQHENVITTAGKKALIDALAGYIPRWVGSIGVGIGNVPASAGDKNLQFRMLRVPVVLSSADYLNNAVVYKGTIPAGYEFVIQEAGAFSGDGSVAALDSQLLLDFNQTTDIWSGGTFTASNSRVGSMLTTTAAASATSTVSLAGVYFDLSSFRDSDKFLLAYRASNAFVASFSVRLKTDDLNYYSLTVNAPNSGAYTIAQIDKSSAVATGAPDWANINSVDVVTTSTAGGAGIIGLDALVIENRTNVSEEDVLVSRSVLGSPVTKVLNIPLDVEYAVTL